MNMMVSRRALMGGMALAGAGALLPRAALAWKVGANLDVALHVGKRQQRAVRLAQRHERMTCADDADLPGFPHEPGKMSFRARPLDACGDG